MTFSVIPSRSGSDEGGTALDSASVTLRTVVGFNNAVVLPLGWRFDFSKKDHHINEHAFGLRNIQYQSALGTVSWTAHLNYSDKNFDDDYNWRYDVAILAFNNGSFSNFDMGPFDDGGGSDDSTASKVIPQ